MERIVINGRLKQHSGTAAARRARRDGWVIGNLYGHGEPNVAFVVRHDELARQIHAEHHFMTLDLDGEQESGLIKELQYDSLGERILHVDFARVSMDEVIETSVPIHTMGNARGVAAGGVMDLAHHEITVRGRARDIPESISVEVTDLGLGDTIRVSALNLPDGVEALLGPEEAVVIVQTVKGEAEADEEALLEGGEEAATEGPEQS